MNTPGRQVATREERPPVKVDLLKPISDLDEAIRLSDQLALSEVVPRSLYGKSASILHVILTGQALNLHWTEALRVLYSPGPGQIGMRGQFLLSQLRKAGHIYKMEETEGSCTFTLTRGDTQEVFSSTFTIEDAIQAGLVKRAESGRLVAMSRDNKPLPWMQYTKRMLRWRAVSDCVSFGAPEVSLGMEIEGDLPEPEPEVQLKPSAPAPPSPVEAATGEAAGQADQLRKLDERMRPATMTQPVEDIGDGGDEPGPTPSATPAETPVSGPSETASAPRQAPVADDPGDPDHAAGKAKDVVLSEWFTAFGYDPKQYPAEVLRACSAFTRRRITGSRAMKAAEVMQMTNALSALYRSESELAPVSRLAEQVEAWEQAWRDGDPDSFASYEESK